MKRNIASDNLTDADFESAFGRVGGKIMKRFSILIKFMGTAQGHILFFIKYLGSFFILVFGILILIGSPPLTLNYSIKDLFVLLSASGLIMTCIERTIQVKNK